MNSQIHKLTIDSTQAHTWIAQGMGNLPTTFASSCCSSIHNPGLDSHQDRRNATVSQDPPRLAWTHEGRLPHRKALDLLMGSAKAHVHPDGSASDHFIHKVSSFD